jgi:hypothetical protein
MQHQDTPKPPADSDQTPDRVGVGRCELCANPFALFDGATYYPAPGWMGRRGQYATIEAAAADGQKHAEEQYGWWQVVDLRTLKIVAGEGSGHTGLFGACRANPSSANAKAMASDTGAAMGTEKPSETSPENRQQTVSDCHPSLVCHASSPCPVCQRGDIWQEAVSRAEYVFRGEAVKDGQEVIDYLLAEVAALLEAAEPAAPDFSALSLIADIRAAVGDPEDRFYSCPKDEDGCLNDNAGGECDCGGDPIYLHHEGSPPLDMTGTKVEETLHRIHRELEGGSPELETDWLEVLLKILDCFLASEGTWYQGYWKHFGITPEQEAIIEAAFTRREKEEDAK